MWNCWLGILKQNLNFHFNHFYKTSNSLLADLIFTQREAAESHHRSLFHNVLVMALIDVSQLQQKHLKIRRKIKKLKTYQLKQLVYVVNWIQQLLDHLLGFFVTLFLLFQRFPQLLLTKIWKKNSDGETIGEIFLLHPLKLSHRCWSFACRWFRPWWWRSSGFHFNLAEKFI